MKKLRLLCALLLAGCVTASVAYGQQPTYPPPAPIGPHEGSEKPAETYMPASGGLSDWILYQRDCCEGQSCRSTPLYTEWYVNSGVSVPVSRGTSDLARELQTGWSITGGARALFYNEPLTRAWVVDMHLINTDESAGKHNQGFPLTIFNNGAKFVFGSNGLPLATLQNSNRTMVGLGLGREWYLWKSADTEGRHWRIGADFGGRYGSHRINLNQFGHVTDVVSGIYTAVHTDLECPVNSIIFFVGARFEWAYTASDILQRNSDMQDLNALLTIGIRY
jgi:hypothetical protein